FFFFQAEDGIRDLIVTGVQTCALPISQLGPLREANIPGSKSLSLKGFRGEYLTARTLRGSPKCPTSPRYFRVILTRAFQGSAIRSEERRVGKECRALWWPDEWKTNETR